MKDLSTIPAFKNHQISVINFGGAAYKEPQQVMVIGDILSQGGHIDLLINIDGFNEMALPRGHDAFGLGDSPFFPQSWKLSTETHFSRDDMMTLGRIGLLQETRKKLAQWVGHRPFRYSVTAFTAYWFMDNYLLKHQNALESHLGKDDTPKHSGLIPTTSDMRTSLGPPTNLKDARDLYVASASLWERSSVLLNNMAASQGGLYVHVLQPNQYFPGSRPPGADNPAKTLTASNYKSEIERGYPYLRSAGKALAQSGVNFYDLTTVFKDDPEPLYGDNCCHLTKEGNIKLVKAIVARVADAVAKDPKPHLTSVIDADYRPDTLRSLALQPHGYNDGTGGELKLVWPTIPGK